MLLVSISVGVAAGIFIGGFRLHIGLPGHKALFWMPAVLIARLRGGCKAGTTAGALSAALTTHILGGNLAGGPTGLQMIALAGIIMDVLIDFLEKIRASAGLMILTIGLAGAAANLICLTKRMISPEGISPHFIFGISAFWFKLSSYAFFGLLSGVVAAVSVLLMNRRQRAFS